MKCLRNICGSNVLDMVRNVKIKCESNATVIERVNLDDCKVCVDEMRLEYASEFKCLGCVLDESGRIIQSFIER